jgi:hypothetical protein
MSRAIDLTNQEFGRLTVLRRVENDERGGAWWLCRCACGKRKRVRSAHLRRGMVQSCGCLRSETTAARNWRGDDVTYIGAHLRVSRQRGPAADYECVDCEGPAKEWSLSHEAQDVKEEQRGRYLVPYSPDPNDYEPRCKQCHSYYDQAVER